MRIRAMSQDDAIPDSKSGPDWSERLSEEWSRALESGDTKHILDLSGVDFIPLFEWVVTAALMEWLLGSGLVTEILIDVRGGSLAPQSQEQLSERTRRILGFVESLDTVRVLNKDGRTGRVGYRWFQKSAAEEKSHYTRRDGTETALLRLTRIDTRDHCLQFIDHEQIRNWREQMNLRALNSSLFEFDEVWRVFCHELAVNIWEHGYNKNGLGAGFIAGRIVQPEEKPKEKNKRIAGSSYPSWCEKSYPIHIRELFGKMPYGFLELCVSDSGSGFIDTLGESYRKQAGLQPDAEVKPEDVLAFAFDEFGTRKSRQDSWATERHALGRILQLVAKYGGALTLRSGGAEVVFLGDGEIFKHKKGHLGYEPTSSRPFAKDLKGAHFQLILPLIPNVTESVNLTRPSLLATLPDGSVIDQQQPIGHLVVLETLGFSKKDSDIGLFKASCEALAIQLAQQHPRSEPVVLDFSELEWEPREFETLLHLLQNVIQNRPTILVEINPRLVGQVLKLEDESAATKLRDAGIGALPDDLERVFGGISEEKFFETFRGVHATLLGVDQTGAKHIFGLPNRKFQDALLSLIDRPQTPEELAKAFGVELRVLQVILTRTNPLFFRGSTGKWATVWDSAAVRIQATRAMSRHFATVADRCQAWRGGMSNGKKILFNLPWQGEWVDDFFECARILSRERYADEAAQRLIYRLGVCLKGLDQVKVLACLTAPGIMLASAIHRCWPKWNERPAIADLGPYLLLNPDGPRPKLADGGGFVVVQDVYNDGRNSTRLVDWLEEQHLGSVLCVVSLIQLELPKSRPFLKDGGRNLDPAFTSIKFEQLKRASGKRPIPFHAMIRLVRPAPLKQPPDLEGEDHHLFWVEPRTLRPFRYSLLRGERRAEERKPRARLASFFNPDEGKSLLCAGHYTYGDKHYTVAIDIKRAVENSQIGDLIVPWLTDICLGVPIDRREIPEWESRQGSKLEGGVTAVLMPLHSRIHYIWPRIATSLAQWGRRVHMWLLDATLFLGHGPAYRLPHQFELKLRDTFAALMDEMFTQMATAEPNKLRAIASIEKEARKKLQLELQAKLRPPSTSECVKIVDREGLSWRKLRELAEKKLSISASGKLAPETPQATVSPLRILILDDAASSARTVKTILGDLTRALEKLSKPARQMGIKPPQVIVWVRYFVIFNQLNRTQRDHWIKLGSIGGEEHIRFVFEDFADVPGVPIYGSADCPACFDLARFRRLITAADRHGAEEAASWVRQMLERQHPIAVDSPGFEAMRTEPTRGQSLNRKLNLLPRAKNATIDEFSGRYRVSNIDVAIWRFYELMYYSHPPSDVIKSLDRNNAWHRDDEPELATEYERYRWTVLDWCICNWPRIIADGARAAFMSYARKEVAQSTRIVERVCEKLALHATDSHTPIFIGYCMETLSDLERLKTSGNSEENKNGRRAWRLARAITLFLLNLSAEERNSFKVELSNGKSMELLSYLRDIATTGYGDGITSLLILYNRFTRPVGHADPHWALRTAAEILFRGRNPDEHAVGTHRLVPQLLREISTQLDRGRSGDQRDEEPRSLLLGSLSQFLAALEGLSAYATEGALGSGRVQRHGKVVLNWLTSNQTPPPRDSMIKLQTLMLPESEFCRDFNRLFQMQVAGIEPHLIAELEKLMMRRLDNIANEPSRIIGNLDFTFRPLRGVGNWRCLTHSQRLCHFLVNWAIDPIKELVSDHSSRIEVSDVIISHEKTQLRFRILTNFRSLKETNERTIGGRHFEAESTMIKTFGATLSDEWRDPTEISSTETTTEDYTGFTAAFDIFVPVGFMPRKL